MPRKPQNPALVAEIKDRLAHGCEHLSVAAMDARFRELGYRLHRQDDCRSIARYMTGPRAGETYPACSTGVAEVDTGMHAFHFQARRDANYRAMQELRGQVFAVSRGAILEV